MIYICSSSPSQHDDRAWGIPLGVVCRFADLPTRYVLHDFLLAREGGLCPSEGVAVLFGEHKGDEVYTGPCLFALELSASSAMLDMSKPGLKAKDPM